ncbi:hypothetical protein HY384_01990 [Candidatus Daviesbacteria bacterium]|nr:hypothetical protein [Candidatus Daviesbacteria bacterium]
MEENAVISDALRLAKAILGSLLPKERWAIINIAKDKRESFVLEGYPSIPTSFGYTYDKTPLLLEKYMVIEDKVGGWWFMGISDIDSYWARYIRQNLTTVNDIEWTAHEKGYLEKTKLVEYYYDDKGSTGPRMHGQAAVLINKRALEKFINKFSKNRDMPLHRRDHVYENGELRLKLQDGSYCTLDLSKADEYRPVFESFYYLYRDTNRYLFDRAELLAKYKELTRKEVDWRFFIKQKSSIVGKMINTKPCLKNRIIWEFDKEEKKYRFGILPLSDK